MIYDMGDTHGNQCKWTEQIEAVLRKGDTVIVNGDFGVGFWGSCSRSEKVFYDYLAARDYTVLFIDGNHENFEKLNGFPTETWHGGRVHKIRGNVIHLMRGEVYDIEGYTVFAMGGGYSMDKAYRMPGVSWWPQEMPSQEEYDNAAANLERVGNRVDFIITHTAPSETVYYLSTLRSLRIKNDVSEELPLNMFLDEIRHKVTYRHWYFGHFHADAELWRNQTAVFSSIRELVSGRIVRRWEPYEG